MSRGTRAVRWTVVALAVVLAAPRARALLDDTKVEARSLAECDERVRRQPKDLLSYACYWKFGREHRQPKAAMARLQQILRKDPGNPRAQLYLGILSLERDETALALFRGAVEGFDREKDVTGQVFALVSLGHSLGWTGKFEEAEALLSRAASLARASNDAEMSAWVETYQGSAALRQSDLGRAERLYRAAQAAVFPAGLWWVQRQVLDGLAQVFAASGRHREAFETYRREAQLLDAIPYQRVAPHHGLAVEAVRLADAGEMSQDEADRLIREALALAIEDKVRHRAGAGEFGARVLLGQRLGATPEGIAELQRALAIGRDDEHPDLRMSAARLLAKLRVEMDPAHPQQPLELVEEAVDEARRYRRRPDIARGLLARAYVRWKSGDQERAAADALASLDELDRIRDLQPDEMMRARSSTEAAFAYRLVSGWLLDPAHGPASPSRLELAFAVMERLRARVLLDALATAHALPPAPAPLRERRDSVLASIGRVQRRLVTPGIIKQERESLLSELERLEADEQAVRDEIARASPRSAVPREPPPSLEEVQRALGPNAALLAFQTWRKEGTEEAPYQDGSSWVLAVAGGVLQRARIPDEDVLERQIRAFAALIDRRDGSEVAGAVSLQRQLLHDALAALPSGVTRLVVVPDGPLHRLPFEALRDESGTPLAARFSIAVAPSVALWLRWHREQPPSPAAPLLALADPAIPGSTTAAERRAGDWLFGIELGALPFARDEARTAVETLGRGSRLLLGEDASERLLKTGDLRGYGVLHFGTHALVDESNPERSAVVLAPGAAEEDGLLQMREVVGLDLARKVIVLAACSSSSGAVLGGEGPMSLARAFFRAGARAVVGSQRPLRDDEAAALITAFYRRLGQGESVAEAMAGARRERLREGAPVAAWAGLTVLGDGDISPMPGAASRATPRWLIWAAFATALLVVAMFFMRHRNRSERASR